MDSFTITNGRELEMNEVTTEENLRGNRNKEKHSSLCSKNGVKEVKACGKTTINKKRWILLIHDLKRLMKRCPSVEVDIRLNNDIILDEEQQTGPVPGYYHFLKS